jgi:hypothetical protein
MIDFDADDVVVEINFGGDMATEVVKQTAERVHQREASRPIHDPEQDTGGQAVPGGRLVTNHGRCRCADRRRRADTLGVVTKNGHWRLP